MDQRLKAMITVGSFMLGAVALSRIGNSHTVIEVEPKSFRTKTFKRKPLKKPDVNPQVPVPELPQEPQNNPQ